MDGITDSVTVMDVHVQETATSVSATISVEVGDFRVDIAQNAAFVCVVKF